MAWAPSYASNQELWTFSELNASVDTIPFEYDGMFAVALDAASRSIDVFTGRQFGNAGGALVREYETYWDRDERAYVIETDDFHTTIGLLVNGNAPTDYTLLPRNATARGLVYTTLLVRDDIEVLNNTVSVTANWGWQSVPAAVKNACLIQANRFRARSVSPFGVAGSPDQGVLRLLDRLDPDVAVSLKPYIRWWGAA